METSVTSIGRFLKVLGDMVSIKSSLANVKGNTFHIKLLWLLFGQLLENVGLLFNLASGHSVGRLINVATL